MSVTIQEQVVSDLDVKKGNVNQLNEDDALLSEFEFVAIREQEVKAHIGKVHYEGLESPILLSQDLSDGCGGKIWESANVMVNYIIWKNKQLSQELFKGQTVVEVGSGTGLVGLAVAKVCPEVKQVIVTDQQAMMKLMETNVKINDLSHVVKAELLNWGEEIPSESEVLTADIILASDCIYLEIAFIPLIQTLFDLSSKKDAVIYLANRKRRKGDKRFFQLAKKKFIFEEILDDPKREEYKIDSIQLFRVKRKPSTENKIPHKKENIIVK